MNSIALEPEKLELSKRTKQAILIFWLGFMAYTFFYTLTAGKNPRYTLIQLGQLMGMAGFVLGAFRLLNFRLENGYLRIVFPLYLAWMALIIIRNENFDFQFIKRMLFDAWYGVFVYLTPLFLLLPNKLPFYKKLFDVIFYSTLVYMVMCGVYIQDLLNPKILNITSINVVETLSKDLFIASGFLVMTYPYHGLRRRILVFAITLVSIYFAIIRARRGLILITSAPLLIAYIIFIFRSKIGFVFVFISLFAAGIIVDYATSVYMESKAFKSLRKRGMEDTRSGVEDYFFRDMETIDWMFGRGISGQYYCPKIDKGEATGYRFVIETDFLNIILKGGIVSLTLLLLIIVPAMFLGLFASKNLLARASGIWILLSILTMYPTTVVTFTLPYALMWICVGICFTPELRNLSDKELKEYFRRKPKKLVMKDHI